MLVSVLLLVLCCLAACQPTSARLLAASIFVGFTMAFDLLSGALDGIAYYVGAAFTDFSIIVVLALVSTPSRFTIQLMTLSAASIAANLWGLFLWGTYQPPVSYDALFVALYLGAIFILAMRGVADADRLGTDWRSLGNRRYDCPGSFYTNEND